MESQSNTTKDTPLIPFSEFKLITKKVLSVTKKESDKQLADYQRKLQCERNKKRQTKKPRELSRDLLI